MIFEMPAGELNPDAPHVWGCPRLSAHGAGWLVDWYDGNGHLEGVSVAKGVDLDWIKSHPGKASEIAIDVAAWLKGLRI